MSTVGFKPTYVSSHYRMPDGEIVRYLTRKNLVHRVSDVHAIVKECPFCKPHKNSRDNLWKLYIWVRAGCIHALLRLSMSKKAYFCVVGEWTMLLSSMRVEL